MGTNHLFAISPFGGPVDLPFADSRNDGLNAMNNPGGGWQPEPPVLNQQTLLTSGPPVTLLSAELEMETMDGEVL